MTDSLFNLPALEKAAAIRSQFPLRCEKCEREYTFKAWNRLPNPRPWRFPDGEVLELRECVCNSTLSIILEAGEAEDEGSAGDDERRALVQGDGAYWLREGDPRLKGTHVPGTVAWAEHEKAWLDYNKRFPGQSAERIAERGGFSFNELVEHLGHKPTTWRPR